MSLWFLGNFNNKNRPTNGYYFDSHRCLMCKHFETSKQQTKQNECIKSINITS